MGDLGGGGRGRGGRYTPQLDDLSDGSLLVFLRVMGLGGLDHPVDMKHEIPSEDEGQTQNEWKNRVEISLLETLAIGVADFLEAAMALVLEDKPQVSLGNFQNCGLNNWRPQ